EDVDTDLERLACRTYATDFANLLIPVPQMCQSGTPSPDLPKETPMREQASDRAREANSKGKKAAKRTAQIDKEQRAELKDAHFRKVEVNPEDVPAWCEDDMLVVAPQGMFSRQIEAYSIAVGLGQSLNRTVVVPGLWYSKTGVRFGKVRSYAPRVRHNHVSGNIMDMVANRLSAYFDLEHLHRETGVRMLDLQSVLERCKSNPSTANALWVSHSPKH
ncbi:hypothetical protein CYMTET_46316, partial [Cymbomonas tetramitiformis]